MSAADASSASASGAATDAGPDAEAAPARRALLVSRGLMVLMSLALVALLGRVAQLQRTPDPRVLRVLDQQQTAGVLLARRGPLVDRRGRTLAETRVAWRLFVDPRLVEDHGIFSETLTRRVGLDPVEVERAMHRRPDSRYVIVAPRLAPAQLAAARSLASELRAVALEPYLVRDYPRGTTAGQVVGFTNSEGVGLEGMEAAAHAKLAARAGRATLLRDAGRRPLWLVDASAGAGEPAAYDTPADGRAVRLTLDLSLQEMAEDELDRQVAAFGAGSGQLVVLDPRNGDVLALAMWPRFDPAAAGTTRPEDRRNRVVADVFEPGSVMKPLVWAAATEAGAARREEVIDCTEKGWWKPERGPVLKDSHPNGKLSWDEVLIQSSNIGIAKVAERMGAEEVDRVLRAHGLGRPTGSGLPGELGGILRPVAGWSGTDLTRIPIGQAVAVTPLQMVVAYTPLANDGRLVPPRMVTPTGPDERRSAEIERRVLSPETAAATRGVLRRVMAEGTGRRADSDRWPVFGKTGTAQLPDLVKGGYKPGGYVATFIGGAPADAPRLLVGCFIHEPDVEIGYYGGSVAAPAATRFMERALAYLGVPEGLPLPEAGRAGDLARADDR
ncbi:peptidoglycan D,D-transpeptidase FtsI family protein [Phycisphaera mikurensis]|uniref:Putative penicillin-binding protein n=1 Tax=Phycisphaera mikurensis (strain NBRC 102666 / KCTC 22515 / FYK2301M01) TaxID=1142394 RepID=I0IGC1_PHYMF|nr:penicillin-binding protein 2 [Phycisphaera mikurensis]MBB6440312.1 cell division protein FtsI (penicillin-binding protein 3) [Phycisphaera mikurensis]BAM04309.1 putative penicillin-binding protein [Phycisphaera mikurensis NBRC 102666]